MDGKKLRALREERGLTRKQVEAATGVDRGLLARYEEDPPENPGVRFVMALAKFFDVEVDDLIRDEEAGA